MPWSWRLWVRCVDERLDEEEDEEEEGNRMCWQPDCLERFMRL